MLKISWVVALLLSLVGLVPASASSIAPVQNTALVGVCPNWANPSTKPALNGAKWQRSGGRKIFIEWSLSPTNLDGKPVSRRFTPDEQEEIRAAIAWWDSVFDTVDFREMSGDYASLKIGTLPNVGLPQSKYWFGSRSKTMLRGWIAVPTETRETSKYMGYAVNQKDIRANIGFLLGLSSITQPTQEIQSRLRHLYGENSCYPPPLGASWDTSNGLSGSKSIGLVGSVQRIGFAYVGLSQIAATVLTPAVCSAANFAVTPNSGLAVNVISQGTCTILVQAREGRYPASSEVLTLKTGFGQKILTNSVPRTLKVGKSFLLKAVTSSGLPIKVSNVRPSVCRVTGMRLTAIAPGQCKLVLRAEESSVGQLRFALSMKTIAFSVTR